MQCTLNTVMHVHIFSMSPLSMHVCVNARTCQLRVHCPRPLPIPKRFCMLGQIMQREEGIRTFSPSSSHPCLASPAKGVSATVAHLKHSSAHDSVSSKQTLQGYNSALFSHHHSGVASYPRSSKSRFECKWTLESKFHINVRVYRTDEQER